MESVDTIKLIKEIEKRPEIWNTHSKEYSDRNRRKEAWFDICAAIIADFSNKTELEVDAIVKDLQYKWKNLRDCYTRNQRLILEQKMTQTGKPIKQYTYARHLKFLETLNISKEFVKSRMEPITDYGVETVEPTKKRRLTIEFSKYDTKSNSDVNEPLIPTFDSDDYEVKDEKLIELDETGNSKNEQNDSLLMSYISQQQNQYYQQMQQTSQMLSQSFKEDNDDIHFFKSLLPTLQTFSLDQKLSFRIEVYKLLAKFFSENQDSKT